MLIYKDGKFSIELDNCSAEEIESMMRAIINTLQHAGGNRFTNQNSDDVYFLLELLKEMLPNPNQIEAYTEKGFVNSQNKGAAA